MYFKVVSIPTPSPIILGWSSWIISRKHDTSWHHSHQTISIHSLQRTCIILNIFHSRSLLPSHDAIHTWLVHNNHGVTLHVQYFTRNVLFTFYFSQLSMFGLERSKALHFCFIFSCSSPVVTTLNGASRNLYLEVIRLRGLRGTANRWNSYITLAFSGIQFDK